MDGHHDNDDQYDSVQWERDTDVAAGNESTGAGAGASAYNTTLPSRPAQQSGGASSSSRQPDERHGDSRSTGDVEDFSGIGRADGVLEVTVDRPLKENDGTKDAYVSYLVSTHTNFKTFQKSDFAVRRRFTDFVFLRSSLHRDYPACAVPPLPDKNNMSYVRGDRFSTDFTQRRAWSLHRFIKRCTLHPVLRRAPILLLFLETGDWNSLMRVRPGRSNTDPAGVTSPSLGGAAAVNSPGGSAQTASSPASAATVFLDSVADTMLNAFSKVHKPDKRFIEVTERTAKLSEDLSHIEKIISRVARREGDLESDYIDLAVNMRKLTPLEPSIAAPLQTFAGCVEETSRGWKTLKDHTDQNYLGSLRDMEAYIGSVKALLRTREQKQLDFEALTDYLQKATAEYDVLVASSGGLLSGAGGSSSSSSNHNNSSNPASGSSNMATTSTSAAHHHHSNIAGLGVSTSSLNPATYIRNKVEDMRGVDHETARRERARKLDLKIQELTREVESARCTSEMFDDQVVREVADFDRIKGLEFRDSLGALAEHHVNFYAGVVHTWERFLADMVADSTVGASTLPGTGAKDKNKAKVVGSSA